MLFYVFNIHTDVNFPAEQWQSFASQNPLMIALASRTQSLDQVINMNPLFNPGGIGGANPYTLPGLYQNGQQPLDTFGLSGAMVSTNFVSFMKQKEKEVAKELSATATKVDDVKDEGNGFLNFLGDVGSGATKIGKGLLDFLLLDDVNTLTDKNASGLDKGIALASFIPVGKVLKIPKAIDKIVDSNVGEVVKKNDVDEVVGKGTGNIGNKTRDQARHTAQNLLKNGEVSMSNLESMIPSNIPNSFKPTDTITDGAKYEFTLADGQKAIIRWHSPDPVAASKYPGSASGSRWTAQIKIGNKQLKSDGTWTKNQSLNEVHIPIEGK
ncbi:hypothetical protein NYE67_13820 [Solibacillus sp. FSL W8-0474]|uniref:hypothetical protein n=1 Tax=Solibacillus sp. FSL W8-0474 TaxID=2975336 RepID=UPI0030F81D6C